ncbi:Integrator complex subunit 9 [Euphorbia peplus]|nr:Integrator complex subunit 9 [Euphorbia peplus]
MNFTCLSRGNGYNFPPCFVLDVGGFRILLDCPLDISALTIFSPVPADFCPVRCDEFSKCSSHDSLDVEGETQKRHRIKAPVDANTLIHAEPWYKTAKNLHLWDPSSFDIVLISSTMGMLGLPFLTQSKGFSAKIYASEATVRLAQLMMEDLVSMHMEYRQFYGPGESNYPNWMKWEELELLPSTIKEVALGKDGSELGGWMPLYSSEDIKDCIKMIQPLKYAEEACYNGAVVVKALSSGLEIGSCNWTIEDPKGKISYLSSSIIASAHAMEFDYHALQGSDLVLFANLLSQDVVEDAELDDCSASTSDNLVTFSADADNLKEAHDCLLSSDESLEESEKLAFICSCIVDSVKAGGSVLIPLNRIGIVLQLLEQLPIHLESSAVTVPIYVISSIASELLAYTNIIPEWLCKPWQDKMFSGEPLFSHVELMKRKKLHVFPAIHSPNAINNWQEPCIVFAPHLSLRLGPLVPLIRRWHEDQNSLLVLENGTDADMAFLPFHPISMRVLNCSFLSGIRTRKVKPLLKILQPKVVVLPEHLKQHINATNTSPDLFSIRYYSEHETLDLNSLKEGSNLQIAADLATQLKWRKSKQENKDIARLEGQLLINDGKYWLLSENEKSNSLQMRPLIHWGLLDLEKLLVALSNMGINGSVAASRSDTESSETIGIIQIHDPGKAMIEIGSTSTIVSTRDENLAARISQVIIALLDCI